MPEGRTTHKSQSERERNILSLSPPSLPPFIALSFCFSSLHSTVTCLSSIRLCLRFICTYVFTSFSLWVCTEIYIYIEREKQISAISLLHSPLVHFSVRFPLYHSKPSNLSLCQNTEGCTCRWNEESGGTYICIHVCMCLTLSVEHGTILDICTESVTG